jgi:hypothetical protein
LTSTNGFAKPAHGPATIVPAFNAFAATTRANRFAQRQGE